MKKNYRSRGRFGSRSRGRFGRRSRSRSRRSRSRPLSSVSVARGGIRL